MPIDPSIYNNVGRVNLGQGLSGILDQQRQRELQRTQQEQTLASLSQQKELGGFQLRDLQRKEAAIPQQQAHARSAELNNWLSGAVQSGRPMEEIMQEAIAKGQEIGVNPEITQRHVQSVYQSAQDPQARSDYAFTQANPELVAKQRAAAMFPKKSGVGDQRGVVVYDEQGGGTYVVNPYTSEAMPVKYGDKQIRGAQYSPDLQSKLSGSKAAGKMKAESITKAQIDLPQDIQEADNTITMIDELLAHPGFSQAVGKSSIFGIQKVPGTPAHDFSVRLDQLKGKQFLQAFQSLKGGGQITEVEGKKATDAISRMNNSQSEQEFIKAANEFKGVIKQGVERAKNKARIQQVSPQTLSAQDDGWSDL